MEQDQDDDRRGRTLVPGAVNVDISLNGLGGCLVLLCDSEAPAGVARCGREERVPDGGEIQDVRFGVKPGR